MGYTGIIRQGDFIPDDKWAFKKRLCSLEGKRINVVLKVLRKTRSLNQNNYYWGVVIDLLSDYTGYTPDEMHNALKLLFLQYQKAEHLPITTKSTAELTTDEFSVYIPSPNEYEGVFDA